MRSSPFQLLKNREGLPVVPDLVFDGDQDKYIIEYQTVKKVKLTGTKDTDFVLSEDVVEANRTLRADYIESFEPDVGILNIMRKVALSGDTSLYNERARAAVPTSIEKDSLGRPLEEVVDVINYQVDPVDGINLMKDGIKSYKDLDPELKKKLTFEQVAKMSDADIDQYLADIKAQLNASTEKDGE